MNRRQIINKILHDHIEVNSREDYTDYKKLITAIEEWHESEIKKLTIPLVVGQSEQFICPVCGSDKTYKTEAYHCNRCAVTTKV